MLVQRLQLGQSARAPRAIPRGRHGALYNALTTMRVAVYYVGAKASQMHRRGVLRGRYAVGKETLAQLYCALNRDALIHQCAPVIPYFALLELEDCAGPIAFNEALGILVGFENA